MSVIYWNTRCFWHLLLKGYNLALAFYALGKTSLVNTLQITSPEFRQVCLADDISGAGKLDDLIIWWKNVISEGKKFGYLVNEKKSWFILTLSWGHYHIEASLLICRANQWTGFYMITASVMKELKDFYQKKHCFRSFF